MPRRFFLSWSQPVLSGVVDHFTRDWSSGALDLRKTVAVVPTMEAGRKLKEALALKAEERGAAIRPPYILTPELITGWALERMPEVASGADLLLTWIRVLQ